MPKMFFILLSIIFQLSSLSGSNSVLAESTNDSDTTKDIPLESLLQLPLEDLINLQVSTSSKRSETVPETPGITVVVTEKEIELFGANNILDILERVTGVRPFFSLFVNNNVISIRGDRPAVSNLHVLVLLDGSILNRDSSGGLYNQAIFSSFPVSAIKQIEIVLGPGSVLYGTNAFAGIINIITKKAGPKVYAKGTVGTFGSKGAEVFSHIESAGSQLKINSSLKYFDTSGWPYSANGLYPIGFPNPDNLGSLPISENAYQNDNFGLISSLEYKNFHLSGFVGRTKQFNWRTPAAGTEGFLTNNKYFIDVDQKFNISRKTSLNAHLSHTAGVTDLLFRNLPTEPYGDPTPTGYFRTNDTLVELTLYSTLKKDLHLVGGGVLNLLHGSISPILSSSGSSWNTPWYWTYAQVDYRFNPYFKLIAGAQINKVPDMNLNFVPRIDVIINFTPNLGLKVLHSQAYRAPLPGETFTLEGNVRLKPELVNTTDFQMFYNNSQSQLALTYFITHQSDLISRVPGIAQMIGTFQNVDSLNIQGIEFESKIIPTPSLYLLASFLALQSDDGKGTYGAALSPDFTSKIGIGYLSGKASFGIFNTFLTPFKDNRLLNPERIELNPESSTISLFSANLSYRFSENLKISAYGTNLFNMNYYVPEISRQAINTTPGGPGRAIYFNLEATI